MYRSYVEIISKSGEHTVFYGNGTRRIRDNNVACMFLAAGPQTVADAKHRAFEIGMHEDEGPISWLKTYIDEWVRLIEQDDGTVEIRTVHICEQVRTVENLTSETDCHIDNAVYAEPQDEDQP